MCVCVCLLCVLVCSQSPGRLRLNDYVGTVDRLSEARCPLITLHKCAVRV